MMTFWFVKVLGFLAFAWLSEAGLDGEGTAAAAAAPDFPALTVTAAGHYNLGEKIGLKFRDEINAAITANTFFKETVLTYNQTEAGAATYTSLLEAVQQKFPQYLDEVKGMASGAGLEFSQLFLWNVLFEMKLLLKEDSIPTPSCTDLYISNGQATGTVMGHNEDGSSFFKPTSYLVSAEILSVDGLMPLENFTAFCYPGVLCGTAFGFCPHRSLAFSVNAVFPKYINTSAIARNFLNRAVLALTFDQIPNFLTENPCSSGFSLNIGEVSSGRLSNVEVSPDSVVHTVYEANTTGYHFNMYMHSQVEQRDDPSSMHRLQRVKALPPPETADSLREILGDTKDQEYPIFRTATPPDSAETLATGVFDFGSKQLSVYHGNPSLQPPSVVLAL